VLVGNELEVYSTVLFSSAAKLQREI